jgi:hypothetical protein
MNARFTRLNRPLLAYAIVMVSGAVALIFFATAPLKGKIVTENDEIQKFYAKAENDQRKISRLPEFQDQTTVIEGDESKLRLLLPEERDVDFIREVEGIAKSTGGTVVIAKGTDLTEARKAVVKKTPASPETATAPTAETPPQSVGLLDGLPDGKTIGFSLTFTGSYADAVDFLHKVDSSPYFLSVLSLDIKPLEPDAGSNSARADMFTVSAVGAKVDPKPVPPSEPKVEAEFSVIVYRNSL